MDHLLSGDAKLRCPECNSYRCVNVTGSDEQRQCARCGKGLSKYNTGVLCWACDDFERNQWIENERRKRAAA